MEGQFRLDTGDVVTDAVERDDHPPQLQGVRKVLGVEDGDDLASGEVQPVVAGLGFGARVRGGHFQDLYARPQSGGFGRFDGDGVVLFEQQQYLKFVVGIVERVHRRDEVTHDLRLVVGGYQHRVRGELVVGEREGFFVADNQQRITGKARENSRSRSARVAM